MWVSKLTVFLVITIFFVIIVYNPASAREIIVDNNDSGADFRSIQEAVNNSSSGDTVIVMPGTYNENIIVNVTSLTIRSESKNSEVLVKSPEENKSVFLIKANNVTLSGFNITGTEGEYMTYGEDYVKYLAGICLENVSNCRITGNTLFENHVGVCLIKAYNNTISGNFLFNDSISLGEGSSWNNLTGNTIERGYISLSAWSSRNLISKNKILNGIGISFACCGGSDIVSDNMILNCSTGVDTYDRGIDIRNNTIMNCFHGIDIDQSSGTGVYNNTILSCSVGISIDTSYGVEILNNIITSSIECGISIPDQKSGERICNNYFNNTINIMLGNNSGCTWNTSHASGINIVGGPYLGGNYWANPNGTGFSQICTDSDGDWICDSPYNVNGNDFDFLPLTSISRTQNSPVANFTTNTTQGLAPLSIQFIDFSQYALLWNWDFDNNGRSESTEKDPVYEYEAPGNYTVNLTVSNAKGTASKTQEIIAQGAKSLPIPNFSANITSGQAPLSVLFTDLSQNAAKRVWDFNNDGVTDSTNKTAVYIYTFPGTYIVNLTVVNSKGTFSKLSTITVSPVQRVDGQLILTEYQITTNKSNQMQPAIYGDTIVWKDERNGNSDIYMYDLSTSNETQITTRESYEFSPDIYRDRIIWTDLRHGNEGIYMYNLSTKKETQITTRESASNPKIYDNRIVWEDHQNDSNKNFSNFYDIYMYDLSTNKETQITTNGTAWGPAIYGNRIVWQDSRSGNADIYMYDSTSKETRITTRGSAGNSAIYGDIIAWVDSRNRYPNTYMYDIFTSKENQISTNESLSSEPAIYGDKIVWLDGHSDNGSDIYMYDLTTSKEIQVTNSGSVWSLNIYGNRIVWEDWRNGNSDIYMCIISEEGQSPKPPVADFFASPTSGTVPLKVLFTDNSTGGPTSWLWDFGDGINSKHALNATHTFTEPGKYDISLIVMNGNGSSTKLIPEYITVFKK